MWKKRETIYHKYILEKGEQEKREDEEWRRQEYKKAVAIRDFRTAQVQIFSLPYTFFSQPNICLVKRS